MITGMSRFVLSWVDDRNQFVALDLSSGNYPYKIELDRARFWRSQEEAEEYMGHFPDKFILEMVVFNLANRG